MTESVGSDGVSFSVGEVRVRVPAGAVPEGTEITGELVDRKPPKDIGGVTEFATSGAGLALEFEDGIQPKKPLEISFPGGQKGAAVALVLQHEGDEPELAAAELRGGQIIGEVAHLSLVWPIQIDAEAIVSGAAKYVLQTLGLEQPEPNCTQDTPTIAGTKYSAIQPAESWICLAAEGEVLKISVHSNSVQPFVITASPTATSTQPITDFDITTALFAAVANRTSGTQKTIVANDVTAELRYVPDPGADVTLTFQQNPAMLYGAILLNAASRISGGLGSRVVDRLDDLKCLASIVDTSQTEMSVDQASKFTGALLNCIGPLLGELPGPHKIVIAAIFGVPQLFVGSVLGLIREAAGTSTFTATVERTEVGTAPSRLDDCPSESAVRNSFDEGGSQPFLEMWNESRYYYDTFQLEGCNANYALVQLSQSSGSSFNYWALREVGGGWQIRAVAGVHLDTPLSDPIFDRDELTEALDGDLDGFLRAVGSNAQSGSPLVPPG